MRKELDGGKIRENEIYFGNEERLRKCFHLVHLGVSSLLRPCSLNMLNYNKFVKYLLKHIPIPCNTEET